MAKVLQGVRILDFTRVFAGPSATQVLGDLGADVIKVEEPEKGDEARYFGSAPLPEGSSPAFLALNRNKRSIALDLSTRGGRDAARRMAKECDVVVHNFRPGAMKRWNLSYEELKAVNPALIYCEFFAFGRTGPMADIGANDLGLQAQSGLLSVTGPLGGPPARVGTAVIDLHAGMSLVAAILAALLHRARTGEGQLVETSLLRGSAHLMNYMYTDWWMRGTVHQPMGTGNHLSVPNQLFPTADGHVVIIAPNDEMWRRCAQALNPKLDRPEWRTASERLRLRTEVMEAIGVVTRTMTSAEVIEKLGPAKVNVAKMNSVAEAADHPQLAAIDGIVEYEHKGERQKQVSSPFALDGTPVEVTRPPPDLGEHTEEVLAELGFAQAEIVSLRAQGAFGKTG